MARRSKKGKKKVIIIEKVKGAPDKVEKAESPAEIRARLRAASRLTKLPRITLPMPRISPKPPRIS